MNNCKHVNTETPHGSSQRWCVDCGALGTVQCTEGGTVVRTVWTQPKRATKHKTRGRCMMITPRMLRIIERCCELSTSLRECRKCGAIKRDGLQDCDCGTRMKVVDPLKVWRGLLKALEHQA